MSQWIAHTKIKVTCVFFLLQACKFDHQQAGRKATLAFIKQIYLLMTSTLKCMLNTQMRCRGIISMLCNRTVAISFDAWHTQVCPNLFQTFLSLTESVLQSVPDLSCADLPLLQRMAQVQLKKCSLIALLL